MQNDIPTPQEYRDQKGGVTARQRFAQKAGVVVGGLAILANAVLLGMGLWEDPSPRHSFASHHAPAAKVETIVRKDTVAAKIDVSKAHLSAVFARRPPQKVREKMRPRPVVRAAYAGAGVLRTLEAGQASYYGQELAGNPTASGETFSPDDLTAAHPTLPFGSLVRVTNTRNGRSVVVRINDRGPFAESRIIDLSHAAAREIGMVRAGTAHVRVDLLKKH